MAIKILRKEGDITGATVNYGFLYNWYAATDARNIAPVGFHVPSSAEWETLVTYLGGSSVAGGHLKENNLTYWNSPNLGADNSSGFFGRGLGLRDDASGVFVQQKNIFVAMSTTIDFGTNVRQMYLSYANTTGTSIGVYSKKSGGTSLRFIADSGTPTTATQNNGIVIPCVTIGTQTWTAVNSCETKYRNGDYITGYNGGVYTPISNATWAASTTGMMCAYNDLESNAATYTYGTPKILRTADNKILRITV